MNYSIFQPLLIGPIRANIEITNLCNLKCIHCYFYSSYNRVLAYKGLTLFKLKKLIKKLQDEGIFELVIGGGEPFCFHGIEKILLLSTQKMFTIVTTNGLLLEEKKINFLRKLPNFSLQISLDGKEKTHKKIRNISSYSFNRLNKIIKKCISSGIDLKIGFMLCHLNVNDIDYICKYCIRENIKKLTVLPYIGQSKELRLTIYDFNRAVRLLRKYISKLEINIRDPFLNFLISGKNGYCEGGNLTFNIDYRGNVSPCCYINNSNIGNIFKLKIKDIPAICEKKMKGKLKKRSLCVANNLYKELKQ